MKKILSIIGLCAALSLTASAQLLTSSPVTTHSSLFNGGTNYIAALTTNVFTNAQDGLFINTSPDASPFAPTLDALQVTVSCASTAGASGTVTIGLTDSPNGHPDNTNSLGSLTLQLSGTNTITASNTFALPMPCARVFVADEVNLDTAHPATNLTLTWAWRTPHNPGR